MNDYPKTMSVGDEFRVTTEEEWLFSLLRPEPEQALTEHKQALVEGFARQGVLIGVTSSSVEVREDFVTDDYAYTVEFRVLEIFDGKEEILLGSAHTVIAGALVFAVAALATGYAASITFDSLTDTLDKGKTSIALLVFGASFIAALFYFGGNANKIAGKVI